MSKIILESASQEKKVYMCFFKTKEIIIKAKIYFLCEMGYSF